MRAGTPTITGSEPLLQTAVNAAGLLRIERTITADATGARRRIRRAGLRARQPIEPGVAERGAIEGAQLMAVA
jgi:hypothetical protein